AIKGTAIKGTAGAQARAVRVITAGDVSAIRTCGATRKRVSVATVGAANIDAAEATRRAARGAAARRCSFTVVEGTTAVVRRAAAICKRVGAHVVSASNIGASARAANGVAAQTIVTAICRTSPEVGAVDGIDRCATTARRPSAAYGPICA